MCSFSVVCPVSTSALGASVQRMPAVSRPAWMLALSGFADRDGGPRRSPVEIVATVGSYLTRTQAAEVSGLVTSLQAARSGVIWIPEMLPKQEIIQLLSHATAFAIPSLYEPLGIVNLEAMACGTAVVGSRVGGIPEVVADGETGLLVPAGEPEPLAAALNTLLGDPDRAAAMGQAGRKRAVAEFGWPAIAAQTADLYAELAH